MVFDGIDGSGHTTAVAEVEKVLKGKGLKVIITAEPTNETEEGREAKKLLKNHDEVDPQLLQNLFIEDRKNHVHQIKKWLENDYIVLCDRYIYSSIAYGLTQEIDFATLIDLNHDFLRPDKAFIFDVDESLALTRIKNRDHVFDRFEKLEILKMVRENFLALSKNSDFQEIIVIDASKSINEVKKLLLDEIEKLLKVS